MAERYSARGLIPPLVLPDPGVIGRATEGAKAEAKWAAVGDWLAVRRASVVVGKPEFGEVRGQAAPNRCLGRPPPSRRRLIAATAVRLPRRRRRRGSSRDLARELVVSIAVAPQSSASVVNLAITVLNHE